MDALLTAVVNVKVTGLSLSLSLTLMTGVVVVKIVSFGGERARGGSGAQPPAILPKQCNTYKHRSVIVPLAQG